MKNTKTHNVVPYLLLGLALVGSIAFLGGCAQEAEEQTREEIGPLAVFPTGAIVVGQVNMEIYRTPDTMKEYKSMLKENVAFKQQMDELQKSTGLDPLEDIDIISLGVYMPEPDAEEATLLLSGKGGFDETKIMATIKENSPNPVEEEPYKNMTLYSSAYENTKAYLAFPEPQFVVASTSKRILQEALDHFEMALPSALSDAQLKEAIDNVNMDSPIWFAGQVPGVAKKSLETNPQAAFMADIDGFYLFFNEPTAKGFYMELGALCASADGAEEVKKGVQNALQQFKPFLSFWPGGEAFQIFFDKALVTAKGTKATLEVSLTEAEMDTFKQKMESAQKEMQQMMQQQMQ